MISSFWESLGSPSNLVAKKACDHDHGDIGTGLAKRAAQTHLSVAQNKVKVGFWSLLMLVFLVSLQALCKSFRLCYEIMVKSKKWWGYQWFGDKNKPQFSVSLSLFLWSWKVWDGGSLYGQKEKRREELKLQIWPCAFEWRDCIMTVLPFYF